MISIRSSLLTTYLDCPRRAAAQQWPETVQEAGFSIGKAHKNVLALIGTGTHSGTQYQMEQKSKGEVLNKSLCDRSIMAAVESYRFEADGGVIFDDQARNQNEAEKHIRRLTNLYYIKAAPNINPVAGYIENRITVDFHGGWQVTGQIDVMHQVDENNFTVRDTKTGAREKLHNAQLGCYSLLSKIALMRQKITAKISGCGIDFLHRTPLTKPAAYNYTEYSIEVSEKLASESIRRLKSDYERFIKTGDPWSFLPNTNSMLCSPRYCRAYGTRWCEVTK